MSSVTDLYQPVEKELLLTRGLLALLIPHQPRLVIQTRSPLVVRDTDLFRQFENVQVNMTITTDSEVVRKVFEPLCPSNEVRLEAIRQGKEAGCNACITMTPMLPIKNAEAFAEKLKATGVQKFVAQPFHTEKGRFVGGAREEARALSSEHDITKTSIFFSVFISQKKGTWHGVVDFIFGIEDINLRYFVGRCP
jgi:DNA repair photolyase